MRARSKTKTDKDGWSKEYTFNTGTFGDKWNFLVFGDPQLYSTKDLAKQTAGWNNTVTQATKRFPESSFLLSVGDQANHSALQEHGGFISPDPMRAHRTVVTMGNHDYYHAPSYEAMYNRPNVEDENYWFTYNNALVINMDTNDWEDFDDDAAFLRKVVKEQGTDKDWVTLTYHHSTFSQAYHQEDRGIQYWRERMTPVISELDVDLVLGGHDHIYTRSHLMNGYTRWTLAEWPRRARRWRRRKVRPSTSPQTQPPARSTTSSSTSRRACATRM
ncbi:metallophosphoesterase [Corynebacterium wankanglinii]|nr:metallophosphoesterase [Corynebacterium wankanglinii]